MEISQGNMAALFQGLQGTFRDAIRDWKVPAGMDAFVLKVPSSTGTEQYPTAALLGDLEELLDELAMTNLAEFMQEVKNVEYARGYGIPRSHVEDDNLGMYPAMSASLARRCASFPYRHVPDIFIAGFATAWGPDGANVFSNSHVWPGAQTWDNLDNVPLSFAGFELACQHLMDRQDPSGQSMELTPTHLVVGPANWVRAQNIIKRGLIGGSDNIHYQEVELVKWSRLRGAAAYYWYVVDASDVKPVLYQDRRAPAFTALTGPTDEPVFRRSRFEYKGDIRFGLAIVAPWLIQAVLATEDTTTTTGSR